jgi:hypothetical protein
MLFMLTVLVASLLTVQARPASQKKEMTFKISVPLEFKGRTVSGSLQQSEIPRLLELPVRNGDTDPKDRYGVQMTTPDHKQVMVYTCTEWKKAHQEKWYAATTYDMAMESFFIQTCGLLIELQNAKAPTRSFISNPHVGLDDLNLLPAEMLSIDGDDETDRLRGKTISEIVPTKDIEKKSRGLLVLSYGGLQQSFWECARADFNDDGIEDLFVSAHFHAEGGSLAYSDFLILTRIRPKGPLELVQNNEPWDK